MSGEQRGPRHTVERHRDGFVVVDWRQGRAVSEPVRHKEFADGYAERLNRLNRLERVA